MKNLLENAKDRKDFYLVIIVTSIMFSLSCFGALYVFYRTYKLWKVNNEIIMQSQNMCYRLPFYTSFIDFFENALSLANVLHTATYARVFEEPTCKTISMILWGLATLNLSLYAVIAIATYFRICHDYNQFFYFGKYDYKLWISALFLSSIFQVINMNNHGARKYWCSGKSSQIISPILLFCLIIVTLIIMFYSYFNVLKKLNHLMKMPTAYQKAAKKIICYLIIFTIHWIPIVIQNLGRFLKIEHPWLYIVKSSGHAFGAVGNAIGYILNEGTRRPISFVYPTEKIESNKNNNEHIEINFVKRHSFVLNIEHNILSVKLMIDELKNIIDNYNIDESII